MDHISKWRFKATFFLWFWKNVLLKMSWRFLRFMLASPSTLSLNFFFTDCFYYFWTENISEYCRKDKSLGVLSQKFLMMFLVSEVKSSSHRGYYMAARRYEICLFFQHAKRNFASPSGHAMFYLLYKHQWNTKPFHFISFLVWKVRIIT